MVHHVTVHHEDAGVVEEARADEVLPPLAGRGTTTVSRHVRSACGWPPISMTWNGLVWMWNIWSSCWWVLRIVHSSTAPRRTRWSMREGSKVLPSTVKAYSCQCPAMLFCGSVAP